MMTELVKKVDRRVKMTAEMWEEARARRALGESFPSIGKALGVSHNLLSTRAKKQGWGEPVDNSEAIRIATKEKLTEKVTGIVTSGEIKKRVEQLDAIADKASDILIRHQEEWAEHRKLYPSEEIKKDFDIGRSAKITAEVLQLRQTGERKAWGLDLLDSRDVSKLTEDELIKLARV
ncbi:MAG: hypothetical protein E6Q97_19105 [Desulfurellales bacterium]|nr:MAG: hypothetical protein E6Q97_19105 [Desulfurellales bacterium]